MDNWVLLFIIVLIAMVILLTRSMVMEEKKRLIGEFKSKTRIEHGKLILPSNLVVETGVLLIQGRWVYRYSHQYSSRYYDSKIGIAQSRVLEISELSLSDICNTPFYIYVDKDNEVLVRATGFIIKSGKYKDIVALCIKPETIPAKQVNLEVKEGFETGTGVLTITPSGVRARVLWSHSAPFNERIVYDEKAGVYRAVREYVSKPRARGVRIELCYEKPDGKRCERLVETTSLDKPVEAEINWVVKEELIILHKDILESSSFKILTDSISSSFPIPGKTIIAGYHPGHLKAKLILDIPLGVDVIDEKDI